MKKYKIVAAMLVMGIIVASGAFAQTKKAASVAPKKAAKNSASLDFVPLFKGLIAGDTDAGTFVGGISANYERLAVSHFSIGARFDIMYAKYPTPDATYFGASAHGRWYPAAGALDAAFLDLGLGGNTLLQQGVAKPLFTGLTFELKAGYKVLFTKQLFVEPTLSYALAKTNAALPVTPVGWQIGLNVGAVF